MKDIQAYAAAVERARKHQLLLLQALEQLRKKENDK